MGWLAGAAMGCGAGGGTPTPDAGAGADVASALDTGPASALDAPGTPVDTGPVVPLDTGTVGPTDTGSAPASAPTWAEHVAPILYQHCVSCHREGGIGPFHLLTYADSTSVGPLMRRVTAERRMPPSVVNASGDCQQYRPDTRWMSEAEIATIGRWVEQGMAQGDLSRAPAVPPAPAGLTGATVELDTGTSYTPNAQVSDDYRCFLADPRVATDSYITGYEVLPGDAREVHHVIVYSIPSAQAQTQAEALDAMDPTPGYPCFGGARVSGAQPLALWAPGGGPTIFPRHTGLSLGGGRKVVIQVHYNTANGVFPDRTRVRLSTARSVTAPAFLVPYRPDRVELPPRMAEAVASDTLDLGNLYGLPQAFVLGVAPHMHNLGRTLRVDAIREGARMCVVDVPRWDFHWQQLNFYSQPFVVRRGDQVSIRCTYDTTSRTSVTRWGEGTDDEMCLNYFYITPVRPPSH